MRVLDLGQIYQGPYATFLMAQAGADVVKLEPPEGEPARRGENQGGPASFAIAFLGSGKRTGTLDLKRERGRELLREMVKVADVLLENFAPGVMERLGVGYEQLRKTNPGLVYASGTAYGLSGPAHDRLGMDITVQAATGVMSITGTSGTTPLKSGPALCDFLGGTHLFGAVVAALFAREHTGQGQLVEVAMQEATYPSLLSKLTVMHWQEGVSPQPLGNRHGLVAPYDVYETSDGHVAIICVTEDHFRNLTEAMGQPELGEDPRYATHADRIERLDEIEAKVSAWTKQHTKDEIFALSQEHHVPCAPVRDLAEVNADEHLHSRGFLLTSITHSSAKWCCRAALFASIKPHRTPSSRAIVSAKTTQRSIATGWGSNRQRSSGSRAQG